MLGVVPGLANRESSFGPNGVNDSKTGCFQLFIGIWLLFLYWCFLYSVHCICLFLKIASQFTFDLICPLVIARELRKSYFQNFQKGQLEFAGVFIELCEVRNVILKLLLFV